METPLKRQEPRFPLVLVVLLLIPLTVTAVKIAAHGLRWLDDNNHTAIPQSLIAGMDRVLGKIRQLEGKPLFGLIADDRPPHWSWQSLLSGQYQKEFENWLNQVLPLRPNVVRLVNQTYFDVFDKSYMHSGNIVIGKDRQLFEEYFISNYCSWIRDDSRPLTQWMHELEELATFFRERGQIFVYLITPSKAAYFPEFIPQQFNCNFLQARADYLLATAALRDSGIPYLDASDLIRQAKGKYDVDLFPRGGTHWNSLGAGMATRELINTINKQRDVLPAFEFTHYIDHQPTDFDGDLLKLANLWQPDFNFPVPHLLISTMQEDRQGKPTIAMVGGSFLRQILWLLDESQHFDRIDYFNYFTTYHLTYPKQDTGPVDENNPASYRELLEADIVVIEENEAAVHFNHTPHVQMLRTALLSNKGQKSSDSTHNASSATRD